MYVPVSLYTYHFPVALNFHWLYTEERAERVSLVSGNCDARLSERSDPEATLAPGLVGRIREGRPDLFKVFEEFSVVLASAADTGPGETHEDKKFRIKDCAVLSCGPAALQDATKAAAATVATGVVFEYHAEEFEW
jgi:hypothetical protein